MIGCTNTERLQCKLAAKQKPRNTSAQQHQITDKLNKIHT